MNVLVPATSAEIAAIRRRYLWMATSVFFLDLAITLTFTAASGAWDNRLAIDRASASCCLLVVNWLFARRLFEPIQHYLEGSIQFEDIQRRLTQLPLLTAQSHGHPRLRRLGLPALGALLGRIRHRSLAKPTIADFIVGLIVLTIFYFTYTYFVVSDYLAGLCAFIFQHHGRNLGLFFGSYTTKLIVALTGDLDRAAGGDPRRPLLL